MKEWYCFKCKEKMKEKDLEASYMDIIRFVKGLKCPRCGATYLTEEYAVEVVAKGEEQLEAKLG